MSDLYLELRSRIAVVAHKTHIGTGRLQEAQDAVGLSNEAIARQIPVSEKTWRRWKEAGDVPTASLPTVARVLKLDLRDAGAERSDDAVTVQRLEGEVAEIRVLLEALATAQGLDVERLLRGEQPPPEEPLREAEGR